MAPFTSQAPSITLTLSIHMEKLWRTCVDDREIQIATDQARQAGFEPATHCLEGASEPSLAARPARASST